MVRQVLIALVMMAAFGWAIEQTERESRNPAQEPKAYWIYTVKAGDTLESIAQSFGLSVNEIAHVNNLTPTTILRPGEVLLLPVSVKQGTSELVKQTESIEIIPTGVAPYLEKGRVFVPMRALFEWLGAEVSYDAALKTVKASRFGKNIELKIGNRRAYVNGTPVVLDVAPEISDGHVFVPLRFVAEVLDAEVNWDTLTFTVTVKQEGREGKLPVRILRKKPFGYVGIVTASVAAIHSAPKNSAPVLSRAPAGASVTIIDEHSGWWGVLMLNGETGWIRKSDMRKWDLEVSWIDVWANLYRIGNTWRRADALVGLAKALAKRGMIDEALEIIQKDIQDPDQRAEAQADISRVLAERGKIRESLQVAQNIKDAYWQSKALEGIAEVKVKQIKRRITHGRKR